MSYIKHSYFWNFYFSMHTVCKAELTKDISSGVRFLRETEHAAGAVHFGTNQVQSSITAHLSHLEEWKSAKGGRTTSG